MDVRIRTFGAEASRRFAFLIDDLGFTGPVTSRDEGGLVPVAISWTKGSVTVTSSLLLAYMGEEHVTTAISVDRPDGPAIRTTIGEHTAHKGHEMRRALDRQSRALRAHLDRGPVEEAVRDERTPPAPGGRIGDVEWDELMEVRVVTTSDGPGVDDVFFFLLGTDGNGGRVVPQSAADDPFVSRLQALPGFDNEALIEAMTCTSDRQFLLWRKGDG